MHTKPKAKFDAEGRSRFDGAGCKVWYVDADEMEDGIKNLIMAQRGSWEFADKVRSVILERDTFRRSAAEAVEGAKSETERRQLAVGRLDAKAAKLAASSSRPSSVDTLVEQINKAKQLLLGGEREPR